MSKYSRSPVFETQCIYSSDKTWSVWETAAKNTQSNNISKIISQTAIYLLRIYIIKFS